MSSESLWSRTGPGDGCVIATAIHDGHALRPEVAALTALSDGDRLREEDPRTGDLTVVGDHRVVVATSRFEVDLNRPRERAVYRRPEDAWGLHLWTSEPDDGLVERSLAIHDAFYAAMRTLGDQLVERHGGFLLLDLHSYNHRRGGPDAPFDDPQANPEVNLGTGSLAHDRWGPVARAFLDELGAVPWDGRTLDVRENVRFRGGHLSTWANETWPGRACALAVEYKKIFMDEWSGEVDEGRLARLVVALRTTVERLRPVFEALL